MAARMVMVVFRRSIMPQIASITLHLQTGDLSGAGTDGDVYLGLCGREFSIDSTRDDFESGDGRSYVLGEGRDDPPQCGGKRPRGASGSSPRTFTCIPCTSVSSRATRTDNWQLQRADVRFNDSLHIDWDTINFVPNDPDEGIWLGVRSGLEVDLEDVSHESPESSRFRRSQSLRKATARLGPQADGSDRPPALAYRFRHNVKNTRLAAGVKGKRLAGLSKARQRERELRSRYLGPG